MISNNSAFIYTPRFGVHSQDRQQRRLARITRAATRGWPSPQFLPPRRKISSSLTGLSLPITLLSLLLGIQSLPLRFVQKPLREKVPSSYFGNIPPGIFSLNSPGSIHSLATPKIALTFDLCGGPHGSGYDDKIMDYLIQHNIPATFFVSKLWIEANPAAFMRLARNPLFEIANHGATHSPASVTGASAYGIAGTGNVEQVMAEIEDSTQTIKAYTGLEPKFYRPGTGFSDEASNRIAQSLGQPVVGFTVNADAGATASLASIVQEVSNAPAGAIILAHANHPEGFTAEGFAEGIRALRARGLEFCKLSDGSPFVHN